LGPINPRRGAVSSEQSSASQADRELLRLLEGVVHRRVKRPRCWQLRGIAEQAVRIHFPPLSLKILPI
jgi:hypothetical protein